MSVSVTIPQPFGIQFLDWGSVVAEQLAQYGVSSPQNEDAWKDWACSLLYAPELVAENVPSPEGFATWREWACRLIDSLG